MARFILDYDTTLNRDTKIIISDNINASMVSTGDPFFGGSAQYCLADVISFFDENDFSEYEFDFGDIEDLNQDIKDLKNLYHGESVNYIEICF